MLIAFGTVIEYDSTNHVYLQQVGEIIYLARILDKDISRQLIKLRNKLESSNPSKTQANTYCFVELTTEEFKNCCAHLFTPTAQIDSSNFIPTNEGQGQMLNNTDLNELKEEIISSSGVPPALKDFVKKLSV